MIDFPLIYCNGDSYSDENYHKSLKENTYAHFLGNYFNGFVINNAIRGSCNRRIIRSSVYDLIQQRELNPTQKIFAVIGLSFELRGEIWTDKKLTVSERESNFQTHVFSKETDWKERLLNLMPINNNDPGSFLDKYSQGRAYFYSPYAERINLMCDLIMMQSLLKELNINFLIFQAAPAEKLETEHLLDFFKTRLNTDNFIDFETFNLCNWCYENNFVPLDFQDRPKIAHYGPDAHQAFAEKILIPYFENK